MIRGWLRCAVVLGAEALLASQLLACGGTVRTEGASGRAGAENRAGGTGQGGTGEGGTGLGGAFGGGGAQEEGGRSGGSSVALGPGTWDVTGTIADAGPEHACTKISFTLDVREVDVGYLMTVGRDGEMDAEYAEILGTTYAVSAIHLPTGPACGASWIEAKELALQGKDSNGDGTADTLSGVVAAKVFTGGGDVLYSGDVSVALTGVPDVTPPTLALPKALQNPLAMGGLQASEPLGLEASLILTGTTQTPLSAHPGQSSSGVPPSGAITFFSQTTLPLSGTWQVKGLAQDLSGHPLEPSGTLRTLQDPGALLQNGFESGALLAATERGEANLVTSIGNQPPISGLSSLFLSPDTATTLHLVRKGNETTLHLTVRMFSKEEYGAGWDIAAGVVGGQLIVPMFLDALQGTFQPTTHPEWKFATPPQMIGLTVSEPGKDILLRFASPFCGGLCLPGSALMIDDVQLE